MCHTGQWETIPLPTSLKMIISCAFFVFQVRLLQCLETGLGPADSLALKGGAPEFSLHLTLVYSIGISGSKNGGTVPYRAMLWLDPLT